LNRGGRFLEAPVSGSKVNKNINYYFNHFEKSISIFQFNVIGSSRKWTIDIFVRW
jgi:hypothetical protein